MKETSRAQLRRLPERGAHDEETIWSILDEGFVAHVGFSVDGQPFVIPTLYGRDGGTLYLHGSAASRMMRELAAGVPSCVTVALIDGLVLARSAFHHSMNYRSVVAFGTARMVTDADQKLHALRTISEHLIPGRWAEVRCPSERELKATTVLAFPIDEASAKVRTGPPGDETEDYGLPVWAGVVPLALAASAPVVDPKLRVNVEVPAYAVRYSRDSRKQKTK